MAAKKSHPEKEGGLLPKSTNFFSIIHDDTIQSGKLRLPKGFVKKHGTSFCNLDVVGLEVPTGDVWKIGLQKCDDDDVWLEKGWREFESFYSLKFGDFVVFRYEFGSSNLQVVIFNRTTTEIQYPIRPSSIKAELSDDEDDVPVKIMSDHSRKTSRRGDKAPSLSSDPRPSKRVKIGTGEAEALLGAESSFTSTNPYFVVAMQKSSVHRPYNLNLPVQFLQKYVAKKNRGEMKLRISNGKSKTWAVGYCIKVYSTTMNRTNRRKARGSSGDWRAFVKDNKLVAGDVCVFELMMRRASQVFFNITIIKATDHQASNIKVLPSLDTGSSSQEPESDPKLDNAEKSEKKRRSLRLSGNKKVDKENGVFIDLDSEEEDIDEDTSEGTEVVAEEQPGTEFVSKYPFFQVDITKSSLSKKSLYVPRRFVKDNINTECKQHTMTLETSDGRSWSATLNCREKQYHTLMYGLRAFLEENNVKLRDFCTFELIHKKNLLFRVSISRKNDRLD